MNNNDDMTSIKKRRKRSITPSPSQSSSRTSRSKSVSKKKDKKKSKKSKKKDHHRSKKRSKSKKKSQKKPKSPKSPKSESSNSRSNSRPNYKNMEMNSHLMYPYPFRMMPNNNYRPPYFPPPYLGNEKIRPPMHISNPNIKSVPHNIPDMNPNLTDPHPPDKIVKDQNFLNSDEKLFESIVSSEMSIRNLYEDVQVSESYASTILYKTIKKLVNDPNTVIFEETKPSTKNDSKDAKKDKLVENGDESPKIRNGEILKYVFEDFTFQNSEGKMCINFGDMSDIKQQILDNKATNSI